MTKSNLIPPGSVVGVFGGGQLGRMFAIAARKMGYRVHTFAPDSDLPANQLADVEVVADFGDLEAVRAFARNVAVITLEFENIPREAVRAAEELRPVRPGTRVLEICQHRIREKTFLRDAGFPVTPFVSVRSRGDLDEGLAKLGYPSVLKSASFGYDGKGQSKISMPSDAESALMMAGREAVLEQFIDFEKEISVVASRGVTGEIRDYYAFENRHSRHILDVSFSPADIPPEIAKEASQIARAVMEELDVVGMLCVEFFVTREGRLLINELAPRPHNSGHLTFDAAVTSQFEQQLRAVCGFTLGDTSLYRPAAMANLLGDLWQEREPDWAALGNFPSVKLHIYGKDEPRVGRKMGHLTATASSSAEAVELVLRARDAISRK